MRQSRLIGNSRGHIYTCWVRADGFSTTNRHHCVKQVGSDISVFFDVVIRARAPSSWLNNYHGTFLLAKAKCNSQLYGPIQTPFPHREGITLSF